MGHAQLRIFFGIAGVYAILLFALPHGCGWFTGSRSQFSHLEYRTFDLANGRRYDQGLSLLEWRDIIAKEAREHSRDMAAGRTPPGHEGSDRRIENIRRRFRVNAFAENVALNRGYGDPALQTIQGWIESPEHRKNLDGDFDLTGVGVAVSEDSTYYFTQIYIRSR